MKISFLLELLFILIIIAFAASKPIDSDSTPEIVNNDPLAPHQSEDEIKQVVLLDKTSLSTELGASTNEKAEGSARSLARQAASNNDSDEDEDDDDFDLVDDDDDDDDDNNNKVDEKDTEPQKKPQDSDEDDDILDLEDDDDEKDTGSEEDDDDFLLFDDDLLELFSDDDDKKTVPVEPAVAPPALIEVNPVSATSSIASGQVAPAKKKPILSLSDIVAAPPSIVNDIKDAPIPESVLKPSQTPVTLESLQTLQSQPEKDNNVISDNVQIQSDPEIVKTETIATDDSVEEEGMIVISDAAVAEEHKNSVIGSTVDDDVKHQTQENIPPLTFHNDKDMEVVEQISNIAVQLSTPAAVATRKPSKKDDEDEGILGILSDSLISDEDDDDDLKLEEEKDENDEDDEVQDNDSEEDEGDLEEVAENDENNEIKGDKKKKKKKQTLIGTLGQTLGFTRKLRSKRIN